MNLKYFPNEFEEFSSELNKIQSFTPIAVSIVGSYGDSNKSTTSNSDLDIVFVFESDEIFRLHNEIVYELRNNKKLEVVELGVHYQFGYTLSIYYKEKPLKWIDIGLMDIHFANNYLVDLPKIDIIGCIKTQKNNQRPEFWLNHLARKIAKSLLQEDVLSAKIFSYRYISWKKVLFRISKSKNKISLTEQGIFENLKAMNDDEVLKYVLDDIEKQKII